MNLLETGKKARGAWRELRGATTEKKNAVLLSIADGLISSRSEIIAANHMDTALGERAGLTPALLDRLRLDALVAEPLPVGQLEPPLEERTERLELVGGVLAVALPHVLEDQVDVLLGEHACAVPVDVLDQLLRVRREELGVGDRVAAHPRLGEQRARWLAPISRRRGPLWRRVTTTCSPRTRKRWGAPSVSFPLRPSAGPIAS